MESVVSPGALRVVAFALSFILLLGPFQCAHADDNVEQSGFERSVQELWSWVHHAITGRVEIGVRVQHFELQEESRRSFNDDGSFKEGFIRGTSVDRLDAEQSYTPIPFLRIILLDYVSASMTYEMARAKTLTYYQPGTGYDGHTDGTLQLSGPAFHLELRYPNETAIIPYAQLGWIWYAADFENDRAWSEGGKRLWRANATTGTRFALGVQWDITQNWGLEGFFARTDVDVNAEYYFHGRLRASGTFPMTHDSFGLAMKYRF